ncbi:MAG: hypothetical protein P8H95_07760, partial [Paracoccaceae bacterium]|nr:hypothetical protein [Paracoccaceae bacterium]
LKLSANNFFSCFADLSYAALSGQLFHKDINFGFDVPTSALGIDSKILNPRNNWPDKAAYDKSAKQLKKLFADNFKQYLPHLDAETKACAIV